MKIRVIVKGEITEGECTSPDCPLTKMYGTHKHEIPGTLLRVHPDDYAEILRAKGMGVDLWAGDDK